MEEFEIDMQCLEPTTVYNRPISKFVANNQSGTFNCKYQSPTYNSYQYNNPVYNFFLHPIFLNSDPSTCTESINKLVERKQMHEENLYYSQEKNMDKDITNCCIESKNNYFNKNNSLECKNIMTREEVVQMLKKKCQEILDDEYEVDILF